MWYHQSVMNGGDGMRRRNWNREEEEQTEDGII